MNEAGELHSFIEKVERPLVVVSTLKARDREAVVRFLLELNAPVYLEGISGLREDVRLSHLKISYIHDLWENAKHSGYPIDGLLRIGGIPTFRSWRDLEVKQDSVRVCSVSHLPFSGLSWGNILHVDLSKFFRVFDFRKQYESNNSQEWIESDRECYQTLLRLFHEEPLAEPSFFYFLSRLIPDRSMVYLGNSLPIREWDLAATYEDRAFKTFANRGLNGIDGQISSFLGLCESSQENWAILGDLTVLYDMAGPWILNQLENVKVTLVVVNNEGGKIFSRMFPQPEFQNPHHLDFRSLADLWHLHYEQWSSIPSEQEAAKARLIELVPDPESTERFWEKYYFQLFPLNLKNAVEYEKRSARF